MVFKRGEAYTCYCEVRDIDTKALLDPVSITCTIYNPSGGQVATGAMSKITTGIYRYQYVLQSNDPVGTWSALVTATQTQPSIETINFEVL